jgi:hypothetical protein
MCEECEDIEPCPTDECEGGCEPFVCLDCKVNTLHIDEYYMLTDEVWEAACPKRSGMLCIGCAEDRLGRRLTADDFTDAPLNSGMLGQSQRLAARVAAY